MKILLVILVSTIIVGCSASKKTDIKINKYCRTEVINRFEAKFNIKLDTVNYCDFVLQEGSPHYLVSNTKCNSPQFEDYLIDYLRLPKNTINENCDFVIQFEPKDFQSKKEKQKLLQELRNEYEQYKDTPKDYLCRECKMILINCKSVFPYQTRNKLIKMKVEDIRYIKVYDKEMNSIFYGLIGKDYGIVEIETK